MSQFPGMSFALGVRENVFETHGMTEMASERRNAIAKRRGVGGRERGRIGRG